MCVWPANTESTSEGWNGELRAGWFVRILMSPAMLVFAKGMLGQFRGEGQQCSQGDETENKSWLVI